jgi:hypothetical protein
MAAAGCVEEDDELAMRRSLIERGPIRRLASQGLFARLRGAGSWLRA